MNCEETIWINKRGKHFFLHIFLPLLLWFINHQKNLELLRCRDLILLHKPCWGSCLLHNVSDGAKETHSGGLGRLGFPLWSGRGGWRCRPSCRRFGSSGWGWWRRLCLVRPLEVRHVAVRQVGDERAVRETPTQIIHVCSRERQQRSHWALWMESSSAVGSLFSVRSW